MSTLNQTSKDKDGIFNFMTLGKKKKIKELEELEVESKYAIDRVSTKPVIDDFLPEDYILNEFEERRMIDPSMNKDLKFHDLKQLLVNWLNDELGEYRIIVCNLEDLYDGSILSKLVEKLTKRKLDLIEVTLNEELQKSKLREILKVIHNLLNNSIAEKWTVEGIHGKDIVEIIQLLIALIRQFHIPIRLPENVNVKIVVIQKLNGLLVPRIEIIQLTGSYDSLNILSTDRDTFDLIYDESPEELENLNYHLILFLNEQLTKLNIECQIRNGIEIIEEQFSDGLLLIFLMGLCDGFFVPLSSIFMTPNNSTLTISEDNLNNDTIINSNNYINSSSYHKLHNMNLAFQIMEECGIQIRKKVRPEDIINCNKKSLLRVLYMIYIKYNKNL